MSGQSLRFFVGIAFLFSRALLAQTPHFEHLGAAEGLSQGMIYDVLQDRHGFLWFATKDGLNRYDGYAFEGFQNNPFDPFSLSDNEVQALHEDRGGRIWAGTVNNGLSVLDPQTGRFHHLHKTSSQNIACIAETSDGAIWVGSGKGANRVQLPASFPSEQPDLDAIAQVDSFLWETASPNAPSRMLNRVIDLHGTPDGKLWVSTYLMIGCYDIVTKKFQKVWDNRVLPNGSFEASYFHEGQNGTLWVGQPGRLLRIRGKSVEVLPFPETSLFPYTDMAFDAQGNVFVSTRKQIFYFKEPEKATPENAKFSPFYRFPETGIMGSTRMLMDRGGLLWIGTNGYGLYKYSPGKRPFKHYLPGKSPRQIVEDASGNVWAWQAGGSFISLPRQEDQAGQPLFQSSELLQHDILPTRDGHLWLLCESQWGERGQGALLRLNPKTYHSEARFNLPISIGMFCQMTEDKDGILWILGDKSTLLRFDPKKTTMTVFDFSDKTGFKETALSLSPDPDGSLWVGTPHGLLRAVQKDGEVVFTVFKNDPKNQQTMNCNSVLATLDDPAQPEKYLWIGTKGGGLNRLDKQSGEVSHFTTANGLPNNVVYGLLPDEKGALWLSTNRGLSKFDLKTLIFQNFFSVDGLQNDEFNTLSFSRSADGRLYFGGVNGITAFYPSELSAEMGSPPVFITRLKIDNQMVRVINGLDGPNQSQARPITLHHEQNQITFEFAAIDFAAPRMNQFRYRLWGADKDWVESTTHNSATYANLAPGNYVFEVVTGGSRGIWDGKPARLAIQILPPWWRTSWAYTLFALLLAGAIWGLHRFQLNRERLKNELAYKQREASRLAELDRLKTNFFDSITHEFRTPLTLLLEPARQLMAEAEKPAVRYRLELIESNARRLLHFVNQLLDLSKLEAKQMPLELRPGNLSASTAVVAEQFEALAQQRGITLEIQLPENPAHVLFNEINWEQVVSNLLSNALKFTDKGGMVTLMLTEAPAQGEGQPILAVLSIRDTGIGISESDLPQVFDRFYQTEHTRGGTGIGLALTKELVERMGGHIGVESALGLGTTFHVSLPCTPVLWATAPTEAPVLSEQPLLLLIEDDTELRQFLRASLPSAYRIVEAADGEEGIRIAIETVPDLVVSDLMMPHKNGFEVAETLKKTAGTSHIPIILLTAKSAVESKMQGLQHGADAYLTKPFRADELVAHIENLLTSQRRLREHFSQSNQQKTVSESAVAAFSAQENEFLQRLIQTIETNLDNESMDADAFAKAVFISRSQLHRKISALTGLSLTEFVRNYRLDRARDMLVQREGSISEIAWRTGFANAKYFSTCFKERFGATPSSFLTKEPV